MWIIYTPVLFVAIYIIYQRFFHPLSTVPGPFLASITPLWLAWQGYHGRRPRLDVQLHRKYGSVVRIAPDEVMFSNPEYYKAVYGAGTHFTAKGRFYEAPTDGSQPEDWDRLDMLTEKDIDKLRVQKRLAGPIYSTANVRKHEALIDNCIRRWFARLDRLAGKPMDIYHDLELLNVDIMSELTFGRPFGAIDAGSDGNHMANMGTMWAWWGWIGYLPWLNALDKRFSQLNRVMFTAPFEIFPVFIFCLGKIAEYGQSTAEDQPHTPCIHDDLRKLANERSEFSQNWAIRLSMTDLGAGVDTSSWTMAAILVGISSNPDIAKRIQAELDTAIQQNQLSKSDPFPDEAAAKLPYLQACMHEATRLWPNIAISLQRIVPPSPDGGINLDGHHIPSGYTLGMTSKILGLNADVFGAEPHVFRPERWLEADRAQRNDMETRNLAFGGANRRCPGMHLAWTAMTKVVASLYRDFDVKVLNELDGPPGPGGRVWTEWGSFPTKWDGLEVEVRRR